MRQSDVPPGVSTEPLNTIPPVVYPPPDGATLWPLFGGLPEGRGLTPRGGRPMLVDHTTQERDSARVWCRMPLFESFEVPVDDGGDGWYLHFLWMTRRRWPRTPWSASGRYKVFPIGPFVLAVGAVAG